VVVHTAGETNITPSDPASTTVSGPRMPPGGYLEFVRLPYDVETTVKKVEAIPALDNFLGTRLLDGR
jgi:hypothetical protein